MQGFFKVDQRGGSYVVAQFYNPDTGETRSECVRDYDYGDCSRDKDDLYDMPIDESVRRIWLHSRGQILVGDTVEVFKGRKVPKGTIATVKDIKPYCDRYGRCLAHYAYFADGKRTNIENCRLLLNQAQQ